MNREIHCKLISPESILLDEKVNFVVCPMADGEIGILPGHAPLLGKIDIGMVRIDNGKEKKRYAVDKGFLEIKDHQVSILVSRARKTGDIEDMAQIDKRISELTDVKNLGKKEVLEEIKWLKTLKKL